MLFEDIEDYQCFLLSRDGLSGKIFCTNISEQERENAKFWWLLLADFWQVICNVVHQQITDLFAGLYPELTDFNVFGKFSKAGDCTPI